MVGHSNYRSILAQASGDMVRMRANDAVRLGALLSAQGAGVTAVDDDQLAVTGIPAPRIAADARIAVYELTPVTTSLEEAYMDLTRDDLEFTTTQTRPEGDR